MRKKYNIQLNPKRLSKEDIARHKDFDALFEKFQSMPKPREPIYRRMTFLIAAAAIAAALALLLIYVGTASQISYEQKMANYFEDLEFVNPPLDNIKKTFASYKVDVNQGGVFEYPSGSKLIVPVAAFTDNAGKPVAGEVTIKYREMHDFVDFFLSGIPMTYDSAGIQYTLESAGMIEIFAEQNGKRVNMAPGKSIDVELVSNVNVSPSLNVPPGYNIYKLDEEKRNWVYQTIDKMEMLEDRLANHLPDETDPTYPIAKEVKEKLQTIQVNEENEIAELEATLPKAKKPVKPTLADTDEYVFDLDFNELKDPNATGELATAQNELKEMYKQYEKMLWQLSPSETVTPSQLQSFGNVTNIGIKKINSNTYELSLEKGEQSMTVKVNPVLSGSDYEKAMTDFNRDFVRWEQQMAQREAALKEQKDVIKQKFEEERRLLKLNYEERIADLKKNGHNHQATQEMIKRKVVNRFAASGFGIWNCDRPLPPYMMALKAKFKDENGNSYKNKTAYLVDKSRNTVYRFLAEDGARLNFNMNSQNLVWLVTDDNKIAVLRPEDFKGIKKGTKEHDFVMHKVDREINDEKDIREILYL